MRLNKRFLSITIVILLLLTLLFGFGYMNSLVSYKYEVQDSQTIGKDPTYGLDDHQKQIMNDIVNSKIEAIICGTLAFLIIMVVSIEPTFKGRITYR